MKKLLTLLTILITLAGTVWADSDGHNATVDQVMDEIRNELRLRENERIDPDTVPPALLEELGDAVMSEIHPDPEVHEWMDQMMGGEGSESLASAHRWMGYRYLTGGYAGGNGWRSGRRGMMGHGMMGPGMMGGGFGRWGMMGNPSVAPDSIGPYASPEEIVKQRYARGEISREEYLRILEDLSREE